LLRENPKYADVDSILLYENGKIYAKSSAALRIAGKLRGAWPAFKLFLILPAFIRDAVYDWIARNRYRWFGKKETCMMPEKKVDHLFLGS
jgi:predicted DCC family thiol-disulfide oxidoreductase YuxK